MPTPILIHMQGLTRGGTSGAAAPSAAESKGWQNAQQNEYYK